MPRHNHKRAKRGAGGSSRAADGPERRSVVSERRELWRGEDYVVRTLSAGAAVKTYRCPGCDQEIRPGVPHLVTWPNHDLDAGNRRHWHAVCWAAREHRRPTRR